MQILRWLRGECAGGFIAEHADPDRLFFDADETTALLPVAMPTLATLASRVHARTAAKGPGQ